MAATLRRAALAAARRVIACALSAAAARGYGHLIRKHGETSMNRHPRRREVLLQGAALGAAAASASTLSGGAFAEADELAPYRAANINWKQAEGAEDGADNDRASTRSPASGSL
jgi:predicted Zn-dependent protease